VSAQAQMTNNQPITWTDPKRLLWLLSPALPLICIAAIVLYSSTGYTAFLYATLLVVYMAIPVADWLVGEDESNPPEEFVPKLEADNYYRWIVAAFIPSQYALTIYGAYVFATGDLSLFQMLGLMMSVGWINGISINTAHELCHKKSNLERWMAKITLGPVAYGHFFV
jgi:alkane 1-monooxygenase